MATSRTRASTSTLAALAAARHLTGRHGGRLLRASALVGRQGCAAARIWSCARSRPTRSSGCAPTLLADELGAGDVAAVVATVGTTSSTSVDPVPEIADLCETAGAWLHVDAAYAGSAWVCPEFRWSQAGVERADSLVVNPHKWLFVPVDCSCLWSRRPDVLRDAFSLVPEYLRTSERRRRASRSTARRSAAASARSSSGR